MGYNLQFKVETPGVENLAKVRTEVLLLQDQYKTLSAEAKAAINKIKEAEKEAADELVKGNQTAADVAKFSARVHTESLENIIRKQLELKAAMAEVTGSTEKQAVAVEVLAQANAHAVTEVQAVGGAIRVALGETAIRSVENFSSKMLGLGPIMQGLFPIIGGIAFAEMIFRIFKEIDPLEAAEKKLSETTKKLDSDYENLGKRLEKLQIREITAEFGKAAGQRLAAFYSDTNLAEDKARIKELDNQISTLQGKLNSGQMGSMIPGFLGMLMTQRSEAAGRAKISGLVDERNFLAEKTVVDSRETAADNASVAKDVAEDAKRKAREATAALRSADEERLADMKSAHQMSVGEIIQYWEKRLAVESENAERSKDIRIKLGNLHQESDRAVMAVAEHGRREMEKEVATARKLASEMDKIVEGVTPLNAAVQAFRTGNQNKAIDSDIERDSLNLRGTEISGAGSLAMQRLGMQRGVGTADSRNRVSAGISGIQAETSIDRQAADEKIRIEEQVLNNIERIGDAGTKKYIEQQNKILEIKTSTSEKIYADETKLQEALHAERERELDSFKNSIGQAFDALVSGHGLGDFAKKFALGQAKTIVENLAATQFDTIRAGMPHAAAGSKMGGILGGTIFGPDPLAGATQTNTVATVANTAAMQQLTAIASGGSIGGGLTGDPGSTSLGAGVAGGVGSGIAAGRGGGPSFSGLSGIMSGLGHTGDLQGIFTGVGAHETLSTAERFGAGIGTAGVLVGGTMAALSQFKQGGVRGAVGGIGAAAGTAAALDPEPISKAVLGIAALATGFIASILPDPKKIRELGIQKTIEQGRYNAPEALNVQQDSSGNYYDYNSRGGIRSSAFSSMPQVSQPYTFWKGNTSYAAPGSVTSPYSAPTINIYAHDSQSFVDMARRNASGLGDVIADHVQNSGTRLSAAISYRVSQ